MFDCLIDRKMATANLPSNLDWQLEPQEELIVQTVDSVAIVSPAMIIICIWIIAKFSSYFSNENKQQYSDNNMTKYILKNCFTWKRYRNPICTVHNRKGCILGSLARNTKVWLIGGFQIY